METKHTPAPWVILPGTAKVLAGSVNTDGYTGWEIAWPAKGRNHKERQANARLIAAAPELLAALKSARFAIQVALDAGIVSEKNVRSTLNEAVAAIAKVEGR